MYKEKKFDEAIAEYQAAIEADSTDVSFRTNMFVAIAWEDIVSHVSLPTVSIPLLTLTCSCAALFEKKDYEKCIEEAKKAIEVGKEQRCDLKLIARYIYFLNLSGITCLPIAS